MREQLANELRGILRGVQVTLLTGHPTDLGGARHGAGELQRRPIGDDATARQDDDATGQRLRLGEVVGGQHDRDALHIAEAVHEVMEVTPRARIEASGRFVQEQQGRSPDDGERHIETAALTTGKSLQLLIRLLRQADDVQQLID